MHKPCQRQSDGVSARPRSKECNILVDLYHTLIMSICFVLLRPATASHAASKGVRCSSSLLSCRAVGGCRRCGTYFDISSPRLLDQSGYIASMGFRSFATRLLSCCDDQVQPPRMVIVSLTSPAYSFTPNTMIGSHSKRVILIPLPRAHPTASLTSAGLKHSSTLPSTKSHPHALKTPVSKPSWRTVVLGQAHQVCRTHFVSTLRSSVMLCAAACTRTMSRA